MATSIFRENFPGASKLQETADKGRFLVGLDLHKKATAVCVFDHASPVEPVFQRKRVPNGELLAVLNRFAGKKTVVCEDAYGWHVLREALRGLPGVTFVPLDARKTAAWITSSGVKTDKIDAQVLCHVASTGSIPRLAVYVPEREHRECVQLLRHRDQLVRQRRRILQQLSVVERDASANPYTGEVPETSPLVAVLRDDLRSALETINARLARMDAEMARVSAGDPVVARLQTIPGIGRVTAFALRYKIGSIARFADAAHLVSYFGLGLREHQSGEHRVQGKIAKTGDTMLRTLLIQGAQSVCCRRPELLALYFPQLATAARLADWRHKNKVVTALARKGLTFAYHIWKGETDFDLDSYRARRQQATVPTVVPVSVRSGG